MSSVFRNYDNAGEVAKNAHPSVVVYPWILQTASQIKLTQPHERGTFFTSGSGASVPENIKRPTECFPCGGQK